MINAIVSFNGIVIAKHFFCSHAAPTLAQAQFFPTGREEGSNKSFPTHGGSWTLTENRV